MRTKYKGPQAGWAIRIQHPAGIESVSRIDREGYVYTGYNVKVWKTEAGAWNAVDRATPNICGTVVIFPCDKYGREVS